MSFIEGLTILAALIGILALNTGISFYLFSSLQNAFNKRIDDLRDFLRSETASTRELFKAELKPINEKLDNHITDTDKKIDSLTKKIDKLLEKKENKNH